MKLMNRLRKSISSSFPAVGLSALTLVLLAGTVRPLPAQSNPSGTVSGAGTSTAADANAKEETQAAQAAAKPAPAPGEAYKLGAYDVHSEFEVGYRLSSGIGGNTQMFRSQVNLDEGIRLLRSYVSLRSTPGTGLFDHLDLSVNNWGDPYNTLRFNISRMGLYDFRASYRNLNYYNYISSFANPLLGQGSLLAQHNLNINYRMSNFDLRLFPNHKIVPFVGYSRNSADGPGITTVETTGNEFVVGTQWQYASDEIRGGVQFNYAKFNLTLEQGYQWLKQDSGVSDLGQTVGNDGNVSFLGNVITLNSLDRGYHGRTTLPTSKVLLKFTPFQNLRMIGRYVYSMGSVDSNMGEIRTGGFVNLEDFLAYGTAADSFSGRAKQPNHNGSFLVEFSPSSHVTFTDNIDTLDYHISGAGLLSTLYINASSLLGPGAKSTTTISDLLNTEFVYDQVRNQAGMEWDLGHGFALRGEHRYTYTEVTNNDSEDVTSSFGTQSAVLAGVTYRPDTWMRIGFDYEINRPNAVFTRNELYKYDQFNLDVKVGAWKGLSFNGRLGIQRNTDPNIDIDYHSHNQNYVGSVNYEPNQRFSVAVDFSKTNLLSDILITIPQNLQIARSLFDQRVAGIGGRMAIGIYKGSKVELGYRGVINRGTFPLEFHQPYASLWIPMGRYLALKPTWQYYGYSQTLFGLENYQTHMVTFSLVYTR